MFRDILWLLWWRREWAEPWGWISGWYLQPGIRILYFSLLHLSSHSLRLFPSRAQKVSSELPNTGVHEGFAVSRDLVPPVYFRQHFSSRKQQMNTAVPCWAPLPLPGWAVPYLKTANGKDFHIQPRGAREAESGGQSRPTLTSQQLQNSLQDHWWRQQASLNLTYLFFLFFPWRFSTVHTTARLFWERFAPIWWKQLLNLQTGSNPDAKYLPLHVSSCFHKTPLLLPQCRVK